MKRSLSILLVIMLLLMQVPSIGLAGNDKNDSINTFGSDITIEDIDVRDTRKDNTIVNGEEFKLILNLKNNSEYDAKDIMVGVEKSSSFKVVGTLSKKAVDPKDDAKEYTVEFKLKYNGGEDTQIPIKIYYTLVDANDSTSSTIEDYINITQAIPKPEPEPEPDGSKHTPNISIVSSKTTLGESGDTISIPIEIKNTGKDLAKDISTTIELDGDSPLYIDGPGHTNTSRLNSGRSESLSFKVKVDKMADDKTYPIKVNFHFYNEYNLPFTATDTVYIKVTDNKTSAQILVNKVDIKPGMDIEPGGNVMVGFEIENKGDSPAKDVKVSLKGLSTNGFSLVSGLNSQSIPFLERGQSRYIFFQLKSSRGMTSGNHDLEMDLTYKDMKNQEFTDESKFFIPILSNKNQSSNLIMQNISHPTGSVGINKDVDVSFTLRNQGQTRAQNIIIKAESTDMSGLVPKSVSVIKLNSLEPGATEKINYKFLTTKAAETKNYPINISVEYEDDLSSPETKSTLNQFLGIFVLAPDEDGDPIKSTPRLIIDKYNFQPQLVQAGENFEMHLSFYNTNSAKTVKNIKIFLTAENNVSSDPDSPSSGSSVFTPVESSNTFYIDSIPPKARVEKTITMFTVPDAMAKTHMITANFEYEDTKGEEYTATELIGVPVVQKSRLETGELHYSPEAFIGEYSPISLEFYNTGKVTLYNMMVRLEGDFQTENGSYYIGNFENGASEFFEGTVIPSEPGPLEGSLVFTYEDSTGEEQEIRKDFSLNVMDMPPMDEFDDEFPPIDDDSGGIKNVLKSKWLLASILLIAGGFIGFKVYRKKKAEKEEEDLAFHE